MPPRDPSKIQNSHQENTNDVEFGNFSANLTEKYQKELKELFETLDPVLQEKGRDCTLGILSSNHAHSGETEPVLGIVGLNERFFNNESQKSIREALLTHELVHVGLAHKFRSIIEIQYPEIFKFYKSEVVNKWITEKKVISRTNSFIIKEKRKMFTGQIPVSKVNFSTIQKAFSDSFLQLEKGVTINRYGDEILLVNLDSFVDLRNKTNKKETLSPEEFVIKNPRFKEHLMDILKIGESLYTFYRESTSQRINGDVWELEEGYANAIMERLSGVSVDELQKVAPQDKGKIELSKKFLTVIKTKEDARECLKTITDYDAFVTFIKENIL